MISGQMAKSIKGKLCPIADQGKGVAKFRYILSLLINVMNKYLKR